MAATPKRGADNDDDLFSYSNTVELTFAKKPRVMAVSQVLNDDDSSSSSDCDKDHFDLKQQELSSDDDDVSFTEENDPIVLNDDIDCKEASLSPGPPKLTRNTGPVSKKTAASLRALNKLKRVLTEDAPSPITTRSNMDDIILLDDSPTSREMTIKVKCHGIVNRYKISEREPFAQLITSIARKENTTSDKVMLYLGEYSIKHNDTPLTIHCTVADILECVIISETQCDGDDNDEGDGKVNIKIQTKESHSKEDYYIYKMSPLEEIVKKYCQKKNIKFDGVKIYFDGEELSLNDTPEGQDMENGDVIDLKHK